MILDPKLAQELRTLHQQLVAEGRLSTQAQLDRYYSAFRERFGPDVLKGLDGESLLETMHAHGSRDSLVYWLEFKDDDEFRAIFGSIAGGSALKFGIYRRRETGAWMTGSPQQQKELTIDEAVQYARKHRDQLLNGLKLLEQLPENATDAAYEQLQQDMTRLAPDVSNVAWGHKYFSLLYPNKLDDFHNPDYQRFHLIRMLQVPPAGGGRYRTAGRYVASARELNIPLNHLTSILNWRNGRNGRPYRYWRIGTSNGDEPQNRWPLMRNNDCIAIGWDQLGDLSQTEYNQESKDAIRQVMAAHYPNTPSAITRAAQQVFNFIVAIGVNDVVIACDGATILGIGKVSGGYLYDPSSDFPHRRPVQWLSLDEWRLPNVEGLRTTVYELGRDPTNLVAMEQHILDASGVLVHPPPPPPGPTKHLTPCFDGIQGRIQSVLERKGQVILYGPPGTGKTFWAERTARDLVAYAEYGAAYAQITQEQQQLISGNGTQQHGIVRLCSFHPAYGYEDFLEGYRPQPVNGQMIFTPRDGIFKTLCHDAEANPDRMYYLIIDEINRGDIPRIFGELLSVLEKSKRGKAIILPLTGTPFHVPENVYLIGTMNTADRSIALLDTALRRRFGFIELMPDSGVLERAVIEGIPLGLWLDALNQRICQHVGRDARNLQIGHSYLLDGERPVADLAQFAQVMQEDIIPLLEEYCYEDYAALEKILGTGLIDLQGQRIRHELFAQANQADLVQALLAPSPDIATSQQAVISDVEALEMSDTSDDVEEDT